MSFGGGLPQTIFAPRQESAVVKWVLHDAISRFGGVIASGEADQIFELGTVFAAQTIGALAGVVTVGDAGNGIIEDIAAGATCKVGIYTLTCIAAGPPARFQIIDPNGRRLADALAAAAYADSDLGFEVTTGGAAWIVGDTITITVAAGNGKYYPLNLGAVDGTQNATAVSYERVFVPATDDTIGGVIVRQALVLTDSLIWPAGITNNQITAALAQLAALGIYNIPSV